MIKTILTGLLIVVSTASSYAQEAEVEIEKGKVSLNGTVILKHEKMDSRNHSFYTLQDDEILMYRYHDNETREYTEDDYFIINFLTEKKKVESTDMRKTISGIGMNSRKNMEKMIEWLLKEKVLNTNGTLNPDRVEVFYEKYNENITERTVR